MIKQLLESNNSINETVVSASVSPGGVILPKTMKTLLKTLGHKDVLTDEDKENLLHEVLSSTRKRRKKRWGTGYYGGIVVRDPSRPVGFPSNPADANPDPGQDRGWAATGGTGPKEGSPWTNSGGNTQL